MSSDTTQSDADAQPMIATETLRAYLGDNPELAILDALIQFEGGASGRQLRGCTDISADAIQVALPGLERRGLVQSYRAGGTTYWTIDSQNRIAKRLIRLWSACWQEVDR